MTARAALLALLLLSACAGTPDRHTLAPGIDRPREIIRVDIHEYDSYWAVWRACLGEFDGITATMSVLLLTPALGCAWTPFDPHGICRVHVKAGDQPRLDHELLHCEGWSHG